MATSILESTTTNGHAVEITFTSDGLSLDDKLNLLTNLDNNAVVGKQVILLCGRQNGEPFTESSLSALSLGELAKVLTDAAAWFNEQTTVPDEDAAKN